MKHLNAEKNLRERIRWLLEEKRKEGVSARQIARDLGVSNSKVTSWVSDTESVRRVPGPNDIALLSEYFGVTISWLCGESECRGVQNEGIHREIGLTDAAIDSLRALHKESSGAPVDVEESRAWKVLMSMSLLLHSGQSVLEQLYEYRYFQEFVYHNTIKGDISMLAVTDFDYDNANLKPKDVLCGWNHVGMEDVGSLLLLKMQSEIHDVVADDVSNRVWQSRSEE